MKKMITPVCQICDIKFDKLEHLNKHMQIVHKESDNDQMNRLTVTIKSSLDKEHLARHSTSETPPIKNTQEGKSKMSMQEEVSPKGAKIIPVTDFITMNTAYLKLLLEAIPEEALNYDEDIFEKDFKEILKSEKVEIEADRMKCYRCNECNFRATSKRCLKTHMTFTHSKQF